MFINLFNGLVYGALLIIMCSGLALIFGLRRVINFAHGGLYMLGAYIGWTVALKTNFWGGLIAAPLVMGWLGVAMDRWGFRLLQDRDPLVVVLVTFGALLIIEDAVRTIWGSNNYSMDGPKELAYSLHVFGEELPVYRIGVIIVGAAVALGLTLWLRFSKLGLFVRAASVDPSTTAMQGVNTDALSALVVGVGTGLAGLAGVVAAPFLSLAPSMSAEIVLDSFVVVITGGLGSLAGAFIAAIVLGLVQTFGTVYVPEIAVLLPFLLMAAVLLWRPSGIAGNRT